MQYIAVRVKFSVFNFQDDQPLSDIYGKYFLYF